MKKYIVTIAEEWVRVVEIEAESKEEAEEAFRRGEDVEDVSFDFSSINRYDVVEKP